MDNEMKFDPLTGQPLNTSTNNLKQAPTEIQPEVASQPEEVSKVESETVQTNNNNISQEQIQNNMQSIATVDQSSEKFLNNSQNNTNTEVTKNNEKSSYIFIFILFLIILLAIIFLFPILNNYF